MVMMTPVAVLVGFLALCYGTYAQEITDPVVVPDECASKIDLIILVDGSKSVTQKNFLLVKEWIKNLAKSFKIESGNVQIGVVQYSYWNQRRPMWRQSYIKTEIRLGEYKSIELFNRAVDRMRYQGYQTFTAHALTKIVNYDFQGRNSRYPEAQRAIILLTDGKATDGRDLPASVEHAENEAGAAIFAVGVGDYSITELRLITHNDRSRIFELQNFSQLETVVYDLPRLLQGDCNCDPEGSLSKDCDICTRQCVCKTNVVGKRCDACIEGTYNVSNPDGCVACGCNQKGTEEGFSCDKVTGECHCQPGIVGEECDRCRNGRYGFPECRVCECNGRSTTCDQVTGICIKCNDNRRGDHCETCRSAHYMSDSGQCFQCQCNGHIKLDDPEACNPETGECLNCLHGTAGIHCELCHEYHYRDVASGMCQSCGCDLVGTDTTSCLNGRCTCDQATGQCTCKSGATGIFCEQCADEYWGFALGVGCFECNCHPEGSVNSTCDKDSGECSCSPGHIGSKCENCSLGFFRENVEDACRGCNCNPNGTDACQGGYCECDRISGQCPCLPGFLGLTCSLCDDKFWDTGDGCAICGCDVVGSASPVCDKNTGECLCLPGYSGKRCQLCDAGLFRSEIGDCAECECNEEGTDPAFCEDGYCTCESSTGQCPCMSGVTGVDCSNCENEFWGLTYGEGCKPCRCSSSGSASQYCDKITGKCDCFTSYTGDRCDTCEHGYSRQLGQRCVACECVFLGTDNSSCENDVCSCDELAQCHCLPHVSGLRCDHCQTGYWGFGSENGCKSCACDKMGSFGASCDQESGDCECLPSYTGAKCNKCVSGFYRPEKSDSCRECLCNSLGTQAHSCEEDLCSCDAISGQCQCRPNVVGTTCNECANEFWNFGSGEGCQPCSCHGSGAKSNSCDKLTGQCVCHPGHRGKNCGECVRGHGRANEKSVCSECECNLSGTNSSHCDLGICTCNPSTGQCPCLPNVVGVICNECSDSYWDYGHSNGCQKCQCHALGSLSQMCDKTTGECECLPGHKGPKCNECQNGYSRKNRVEKCKVCRCDVLGTDSSSCEDGLCSCDPVTGQCPCLPGVAGLLCTRCEDEFWGVASGQGCKPCQCSPQGSRNLVCNKRTGECQCLQGHTGKKCDKCARGYFRMRAEDVCKECNCDMYGRNPSGCGGEDCNCEPSTGQCQCLPNVTGLTCDRCVDGFWDIRSMQGCKPCGCDEVGSASSACEKKTGQCDCALGHAGRQCEECDKDYFRSDKRNVCKPDTLSDQTNPSTSTPTEKPVTRSMPRPFTASSTARYTRPYLTPFSTITTARTGCGSCMKWPSYCHGWMCRRRWPHHQFQPSPRRCNYGHTSCQYSVSNSYENYGSRRRTTAAPRTPATPRPFYGYSLYANGGSDYKFYPRSTITTRSRSNSYRSRTRPISYGLYNSLYGKWKK